MKTINICIGHITHDRIVTPTLDRHCPGGTSWYYGWGMFWLNASAPQPVPFRLITAVGEPDLAAVEELRAAGVQVDLLPSPATVYFENRYGSNMNERTQQVLSKAAPFTWELLEPLIRPVVADGTRPTFILGSLLADDFPVDVLQHLHELGTVVVDGQGYLREVKGTSVVPTDWPDKLQAMPYIDILKVNEQEMQVLTGQTDPFFCGRKIAEWGVGEILLTYGDQVSVIYTRSDDRFITIPAYKPQQLIDATGCGDSYTMGYLFSRSLGYSLEQSGRFGAAVAALKLEHLGPFSSTYDRVMQMINC